MTRRASTARDAIRRAFNYQPNLMTPRVVAYGWQGSFAWELSTGEGIRIRSIHGDGPVPALWGVSVVWVPHDGPPVIQHDKSECFHSEADARAYIADMFVKRPAADALAALQEQAEAEGWDE